MSGVIYVDMDGVLADFDLGFVMKFGRKKSNNGKQEDKDWADVRGTAGFYEQLPPMPDMRRLWNYLLPHNPIVLTGVPSSVAEAPANKVAWVRKHLGPEVPVITCASRNKCFFCTPGDILIDDWERYKDLWIGAGGIWITHIGAETTIHELQALGI